MYNPRIIHLLVLIIMVLTFTGLSAQEKTTCSYCKQAFTTRSLYCTHCGTWWVSPDNIIKNEMTLAGYFDRTESEGTGLDTLGNPSDFTGSDDRLAVEFSFRHYFNSRYQHPIVPFSFIPYNYRSDFIEAAVSLSDISSEFDFPGGDIDTEHNAKAMTVALSGIRHLDKMFLGGSLTYSKRFDDELASDEWSDQWIVVRGNAGYYNPSTKIGVDIQLQDIKYNGDGGESGDQNLRLKPFVEYLPTPTLLLTGSVDYLFDTGDDYYKYGIPVEMRYITLDNWWEFAILFSYYGDKSDLEEVNIAVEIGKLYRNSSVFVKPQYTRTSNKNFDGTITGTRVLFGGTHAFMNRRFLLTASAYYGSGEDFDPAKDISEYGGSLNIKAFF